MIKEIVISNNKANLRYRINQLACVGMCIWFTLPYCRVRIRLLLFIIILGIWLITTDLKWLTHKLPKDIFCVAIFFATFVPYSISGELTYGLQGAGTIYHIFPFFFLGLFINHYYMYYKKDYNTLGKIALVSLIAYAVGALQTYYGLLVYPLATRALAGSVWSINPEMGIKYQRMGIGGFGYIYAACFMLIAALYPIIKKSPVITIKYKLISAISFVALSLMILKASYTIALIISFLGIILVLIVKKRSYFIFYTMILFIILLLLPNTLFGEFFLKVAAIFSKNETVHTKFMDLASTFLYDSFDGETVYRVKLYSTSMGTFFKYPLFGVYGPFGGAVGIVGKDLIGGHSGWVDLLGLYGLFAGVPLFFALYFNIKKHLLFYKNSRYLGFMIVISFIFLLLGIVNPIFTIFEIGFMVFCIVPSIPFLPYAYRKKKHETLII